MPAYWGRARWAWAKAMDGWWDAASLDGLLFHLLAARVDERVHGAGEVFDALRARLTNLQSPRRSGDVGRRH